MWAGFVAFYVLWKRRWGHRKIQAAFPVRTEHQRDILYSLSTVLIFGLVFSFTVTIFSPFTRIYNDLELYGRSYYWLSFILILLVHDTYFYWTHRLIHTRRLFSRVHLVHHKSTNPSPWTSYAFHPFEAIIHALVVPLVAMLFPIHLSALIIYFFLQFIHNIYGHLGFELIPKFIRQTKTGRLLNTSIIHNSHHKNVKGNYGLYFTIWDRLMGTLNEK